jgi:hypothetical protein
MYTNKHKHFIKMLEKFEDINGIIGSRKSKKVRQYNGLEKNDKRTINDQLNIHI